MCIRDSFYDVPKEFEFDGASVPWPLILFTPKTHSLYLGAAALHDWLYGEAYEEVDRATADKVFREAMIVLGTNWIWAGMMWRAVRAAGWLVWYRRGSGTFAHRFMKWPGLIRWPLAIVAVAAKGLGGIFLHDIWALGRLRAEARRIAALEAQT